MNWHTLLTAKETSCLVNERYCKLPTMLLNKVTFSKEGESNFESLVHADMGEEMELAPIILVFFNKSKIYLRCDISRPLAR